MLFSELLELSCNPSSESLNKIVALKKEIVQVNGTQSKMTLQYLQGISLMLSFVAAARESNIEPHLQAEEKFLKMVLHSIMWIMQDTIAINFSFYAKKKD